MSNFFYPQELTISEPLSFVEDSPFGILHPKRSITVKFAVIGEIHMSDGYLYRNTATMEYGYLGIRQEKADRLGSIGWGATAEYYNRLLTENITPAYYTFNINAHCHFNPPMLAHGYGPISASLGVRSFQQKYTIGNNTTTIYRARLNQALVFYHGINDDVREIYRIENDIPGSIFMVSGGTNYIHVAQMGPPNDDPPTWSPPNWNAVQLSSIAILPFTLI